MDFSIMTLEQNLVDQLTLFKPGGQIMQFVNDTIFLDFQICVQPKQRISLIGCLKYKYG